ncbi:hypothetical protein [Singulisphaera acidiphila]|uniref:Uncharacterized protein n=1 Tax=Singulisphaera acidiphila (strain ATCC BAA-1392 / DSM 18658 / VKM B-2454 / MOB10) TaxID=886293 RepID=L0DLF9_SINAD|nr:hypothetical protein [Singulisphaera acidiphila]AGA29665.1 hypothetical protein Sinac_5524 [Singulisphaera acidiphila DSM 18658]
MRSHVTKRFFALSLALAAAVTSQGAGLADPLLRLTPPDAGITLAIEDLRGHTQEYLASPLAGRLARLPFVRSWMDSPQVASFQAARRQIETVLGTTLKNVRDELLGDAVVLTLWVPPQGKQEEARGMLLIRARDRKLLGRLIEGINDSQTKKGELLRIVERTRNGISYQVREFAPQAKRPAEYYTTLADQTFAWSNSEELVQGVIDRSKGTEQGLSDVPGFRQVRERLPQRCLLSLFVNPRFLEMQIAASPKPAKPLDERLAVMLSRYVDALEYIGCAIELRGASSDRGAGIILHTEEGINPDKLPLWMKRWAARPSIDPPLDRVPNSALGVASAHIDFEALEDVLRSMTPSSGQRRLDNLLLGLSGVMLGRDLRTEILPKLGPAVFAYLATTVDSGQGQGFSYVLSVALKGEPGKNGVAAALENGLRTFFALYALDEKHDHGQLEVESREIQGVSITALSPTSPFAFAFGQGRLVIGGIAEAVAGAIHSEASTNRRFSQLRATYFPQAETFLCIDLEKVRTFAESHRTAIARRLALRNEKTVENAQRELDLALALMGEFRDLFVTSVITPDARSAHRMLGLIAPTESPAKLP